MAKRKQDMMTLQNKANEYAMGVAKEVALLPTSMPDADFGKYLDTIMRELVKAWAEGYMEGSK